MSLPGRLGRQPGMRDALPPPRPPESPGGAGGAFSGLTGLEPDLALPYTRPPRGGGTSRDASSRTGVSLREDAGCRTGVPEPPGEG